jgi:1,4-alpha-glucan branching enzyme
MANRKAIMAQKTNKKDAVTGHGQARAQKFSLVAPSATKVQLVGSFTHWQQKPITMHKDPEGVWETTVLLAPGAHPYRFIVDGQWQDDPGCSMHEPNPYGGQNALRRVA